MEITFIVRKNGGYMPSSLGGKCGQAGWQTKILLLKKF